MSKVTDLQADASEKSSGKVLPVPARTCRHQLHPQRPPEAAIKLRAARGKAHIGAYLSPDFKRACGLFRLRPARMRKRLSPAP